MSYAAKIRAARAWLNWNPQELADRTGLSKNGIGKIERGQSAPNATSQKKIERAFENAGMFFTRRGIEMDDSPVVLLQDDDPEACYLLLLDDVAQALKDVRNPELLISYADDRVSSQTVNNRYRDLRASGVGMRQLVEAGNTYLLAPVEEYRAIPSELFINRVTLIYGDNVATVTAGENIITIIRDPINAERERASFNLHWINLEQPTESTADECF